MRIRNFRFEDVPELVVIQQAAAQVDGLKVLSETAFVSWLTDTVTPEDTFVVTDDDDELNTWGQAGTLEGIEGEIIGYTVVQLLQDQEGYHFRCQGSVHPAHRRRNAGRALLICALNRARLVASEFEFEAEQEGIPIYFEALLPAGDEATTHLAMKCDMQLVEQPVFHSLHVYRRLL
jgi:ribosomal protein S18 acetylase RimI-like enzyme